jgi:hypothetical protein
MAVRSALRAAALYPQEDSWYLFLLEIGSIPGLEGLGQLKKFSDLIGNRTRDFPACSIVPQPNTLPHAEVLSVVTFKSEFWHR